MTYLYLQPRKGYYLWRLREWIAKNLILEMLCTVHSRIIRLFCAFGSYQYRLMFGVYRNGFRPTVYLLRKIHPVFITDYSLSDSSSSSLSSATPNNFSTSCMICSYKSAWHSNSMCSKTTLLSYSILISTL